MSARSLLLLFLALTAFHCLGNWALPLIDRDEPRFAEASREMRERQDFVVPYLNDRPRYDKPPLIYWLQCAAYATLGENEFAARLPSAICAALVSVVIAAWATRLFDSATAWRAALIFALCLQTMIHARAAVADMAMILFVTLAAWAGWEWRSATTNRTSWLWSAVFWLSLGLGFLAKGPIALLPLGMLWWGGLAKPSEPGRWWAQNGAGFLVALGLVAAWGIPALLRTQGDFAAVGLGKHVVARSVSSLEGHGAKNTLMYLATLPFFFLTGWISFFPWCLWVPAAFRHYRQRGLSRGSAERYLATGAVLCFVIFTLVRTKLPHYTLPAFPLLALLLAGWWRELGQPAVFKRTALIAATAAIVLFLVGFPLGRQLFPSEVLFEKAEPLLRPEMELATVEYHEPSLVWLFRGRIDGFHKQIKPGALPEWLAKPGPRVAIFPTKELSRLTPDPSWQTFRSTGVHFVKGRHIDLTMIVKP